MSVQKTQYEDHIHGNAMFSVFFQLRLKDLCRDLERPRSGEWRGSIGGIIQSTSGNWLRADVMALAAGVQRGFITKNKHPSDQKLTMMPMVGFDTLTF